MFEEPNHHSPPATPLPPAPSLAPFTVKVIEAVPTGIELGVNVMPLKVGGVRSISNDVLAVPALQLPAASRERT
jgi:hypothetical protein